MANSEGKIKCFLCKGDKVSKNGTGGGRSRRSGEQNHICLNDLCVIMNFTLIYDNESPDGYWYSIDGDLCTFDEAGKRYKELTGLVREPDLSIKVTTDRNDELKRLENVRYYKTKELQNIEQKERKIDSKITKLVTKLQPLLSTQENAKIIKKELEAYIEKTNAAIELYINNNIFVQ